jgi:hypothetical protein
MRKVAVNRQRLAVRLPIIALLICANCGPTAAQHMSRPDIPARVTRPTDAFSSELVVIPVQLGPASPNPPPSPSSPPNATAPTPLRSSPPPNPAPSSPLPSPLPPTSSSNAPQAGTSTSRATYHSGANHRMKQATKERDHDTTGEFTSDISIPRLPNVFRNCEHPAPWFCNNY